MPLPHILNPLKTKTIQSMPAGFFNEKTPSLRYNSYTIQFTNLICIVHLFLLYLACPYIIYITLESFHLPKETLYLLTITPGLPPSVSSEPHYKLPHT